MLINEHQGGNRSSFSPSSSPFHFFLNDKIILGYPFKTEAQFPRRCQGAANIASRMFSHGMWFLLSLVLVGVSRWKQEGVLDPGPGLWTPDRAWCLLKEFMTSESVGGLELEPRRSYLRWTVWLMPTVPGSSFWSAWTDLLVGASCSFISLQDLCVWSSHAPHKLFMLQAGEALSSTVLLT